MSWGILQIDEMLKLNKSEMLLQSTVVRSKGKDHHLVVQENLLSVTNLGKEGWVVLHC